MADWIDNLNLPPTPNSAGSAGPPVKTGGDWVDNLNLPPPAPPADPTLAERFGFRPATPAERTVASGGVTALTGGLNFLPAATQALGSFLESHGIGGPTPTLIDNDGTQLTGPGAPRQPLPSELAVHALGLDMPADASSAERVGTSILPWLIPTSNALNRVGEAAGATNKIMTAGRSLMAGMGDWAASSAAQDWAAQHGFGPLATSLAGMVGGTARGAAARTVGSALPSTIGIGAEEGRQAYDANSAVGVTPPVGTVAGPTLSTIESGLGSLPIAGAPVTGARNAQSNAIANAADTTLQALSPDATSVREAGPESLNQTATQLGTMARNAVFGGETGLKSDANQLENNVISQDRRISAGPVLDAALDIATNPNNAAELRNAATAAHNQIASSVAPDGTITFGALKQARTALGANIDNMFQAQQGTRGIKNTLHAGMQPVEDAMTGQLVNAAEQAQPGAGAQWADLDQRWSTNAQLQRDLKPLAGKLGEIGDTARDSEFQNRPTSQDIAGDLNAAVQGDQPYIDAVQRSLGPDAARSAVAEAIAAKAVPRSGARSVEYRPDTLGSRGSAEIGPDAMNWIRGHVNATPGAPIPLQQAITAGKTVGEPREPGNLGKTIAGTILAAGPVAGAMAAGGPGAAVLGGLAHTLASGIEDPSFVRSVAGRGVTPQTFPLVQQWINRGGLGALPQISSLPQAAATMPQVLSPLTRAILGVVR